MPNWCNNVVEISHPEAEMMQRVKTSFAKGEFLNEFIPVPDDLQIVAGHLGDTEANNANIAKGVENIKEYGYADWYTFCVNEWGTKWDVGGGDGSITENSDGSLTLSFDSAWAPPCVAYEKLVDMGFTIKAYYDECGMAFAGVWEDGFDDYYEYGGMTSEQVRDELPDDLDEMFNISENIQMWEDEQEESEDE